MPLSLELHLDERQPDRVFVSVLLKTDGSEVVDGVALELHSREHGCLAPRLLLPISGSLSGPIMTQAELRSEQPIPQGAWVVGTVWSGTEQLVAQCPTDPCRGLRGHVRGCTALGTLRDKRELADLSEAQCAALRATLPWIGEPAPHGDPGELEAVTEDEVDHICDEMGLDGDCAQWLKDLMAEDA